MPVDAFRKKDGVQIETPKPAALVSPGGDEVGIIEWLYSTQFDLDSCGNTFGLIRTRDGMGLPSRIDLVPVEDVTVLVKKGVKSYRIAGAEYDAAEVWHERQFTTSGSPVGLSPLAYSASSISGYVSAQEFVRQWFAGGAFEQWRIGERAQRIVQRITVGTGIKTSAQVGPGLAQRVLVQRRIGAYGFHALARHGSHSAGQARLSGRITAAAGVKVDLHVHHGDDRAFDQPDLGAAVLRPVLDGQERPCTVGIENGCSADE